MTTSTWNWQPVSLNITFWLENRKHNEMLWNDNSDSHIRIDVHGVYFFPFTNHLSVFETFYLFYQKLRKYPWIFKRYKIEMLLQITFQFLQYFYLCLIIVFILWIWIAVNLQASSTAQRTCLLHQYKLQ